MACHVVYNIPWHEQDLMSTPCTDTDTHILFCCLLFLLLRLFLSGFCRAPMPRRVSGERTQKRIGCSTGETSKTVDTTVMLRTAIVACGLASVCQAAPISEFELDLPTPSENAAPDAISKEWLPLKEQLDGWVLTSNFGVTVGNASGKLFEYNHGNFSLATSKCDLASTSKWPLAMMFVGLVADGTIDSLDSRANEYVKWWTKDPKNPKSEITLRQLLSFTSGFGSGRSRMS